MFFNASFSLAIRTVINCLKVARYSSNILPKSSLAKPEVTKSTLVKSKIILSLLLAARFARYFKLKLFYGAPPPAEPVVSATNKTPGARLSPPPGYSNHKPSCLHCFAVRMYRPRNQPAGSSCKTQISGHSRKTGGTGVPSSLYTDSAFMKFVCDTRICLPTERPLDNTGSPSSS